MSAPAAERGSLTVTDRAISHLAEHAARETLSTWGGAGERVRVRLGHGRRTAHARVEVPYPHPAAGTAAKLSGHLAGRLDALADTRVRRVAVTITYIEPSPSRACAGAEQTTESPDHSLDAPAPTAPLPRARRAPAALAALVLAAGAAFALTGVLERRYRHTGRLETWAESIADARPGTVAVTLCAAALIALGLIALICALAPGRPRVAMETGDPRLYATLSSGAIVDHLRHAVRELDPAAVVRVRGARTARIRISVPECDAETAGARARQIAALAPEKLAAPGLRVQPRLRTRKVRIR
jgi:hypothetical protein